jgi:hypothetical protein
MARNNRQRRQRQNKRRNEMRCQLISMRYLTPKVRLYLDKEDHPKLPDSTLTKLNYVEWLLSHGYHVKALAIIAPISAIYNEPYDEHAYAILEREQENYGVPNTYR